MAWGLQATTRLEPERPCWVFGILHDIPLSWAQSLKIKTNCNWRHEARIKEAPAHCSLRLARPHDLQNHCHRRHCRPPANFSEMKQACSFRRARAQLGRPVAEAVGSLRYRPNNRQSSKTLLPASSSSSLSASRTSGSAVSCHQSHQSSRLAALEASSSLTSAATLFKNHCHDACLLSGPSG